MQERYLELRIRPILKIAIVLVLVLSYCIFPIWYLVEGSLVQVFFIFIIVFIIPTILFSLIDWILGTSDPTIELFSALKSNRNNILFFFLTSAARSKRY